MKKYSFIWIDADGNDTQTKPYHFDNIKEAQNHAKKLFAECMDGTIKIKVKRHYKSIRGGAHY